MLKLMSVFLFEVVVFRKTATCCRVFLDDVKLTAEARSHLGLNSNDVESKYKITLLPYDTIFSKLSEIAETADKKLWVPFRCF